MSSISTRSAVSRIFRPAGALSRTGSIGPAQRIRLDAIDTARDIVPAKFEKLHERLSISRHAAINLGHDIQRAKRNYRKAMSTGEIPPTQKEIRTLMKLRTAIISVSQLLVLEPDLNKVFSAVLEGVRGLGYERGFLYTYESKSGLLHLKSAIDIGHAHDSRYIEPADPKTVEDEHKIRAIETKQIVMIERRISNRPPEIIIPLVVEGEVVGMLKVDNNESKPLFDPGVSQEIIEDSLMTFAYLSGAAIRNAVLFSELQRAEVKLVEALNYSRLADMARLVGHHLSNNQAAISGTLQTIGLQFNKVMREVSDELERLKKEGDFTEDDIKPFIEGWLKKVIDVFQMKYSDMAESSGRLNTIMRLLEPYYNLDRTQGTFKLGNILENSIERARILAAQNGFEIEYSPLEENVRVNTTQQLEFTLYNILKNAIEAVTMKGPGTDGHEGKISVATRISGNTVTIEVSDNGIGIPSEEIGRIFDPFFMSSGKHYIHNFGLGLSFAREIIESTGGSLRIKSEEGQGTTVMIELNLVPDEQPEG